MKAALLSKGLVNSIADSSVFFLNNQEMTVYFFAHVDDILLIGTSSKYIQELVADLNKEFAMIKGVGLFPWA